MPGAHAVPYRLRLRGWLSGRYGGGNGRAAYEVRPLENFRQTLRSTRLNSNLIILEFFGMKDYQLRGLILQHYYEHRRDPNPYLPKPNDFNPPLKEEDILQIADQLAGR